MEHVLISMWPLAHVSIEKKAMAKIFFCHSPQLIKFKKRMPTEIAAKWPHDYSIVIAIKQTLVDMLLTLL